MARSNVPDLGEWVSLARSWPRSLGFPGLYIIRNKVSGKEYVGLSQNVFERISRHCQAKSQFSILHRSVRKHGVENFEACIHMRAEVEELQELEQLLIEERGTLTPGGYNITAGGEGAWGRALSEETKQKISDKHAGKTMSPEARAKISAAADWLWTDEMRAKVSAHWKDPVKSAAVREKMSAAARRRDQSGKNSVLSRPVICLLSGGLVVLEFDSCREAAAWAGFSRSKLSTAIGRLPKDGRQFLFK